MSDQTTTTSRFSFFTSIITATLGVISLGIAVGTPPLSGPFCPADCFQYPYTEAVSRWPRDYYWMFPAMLFVLAYLVWVATIHQFAEPGKKLYSRIGMLFAAGSGLILFSDYFIQVTIIQPALLNGETAGIALWTQFNSHGLFIALEEIGYLLMSVSFLFLGLTFTGAGRGEKALRWIFLAGFILTIVALIVISVMFGIHREYRFEVAVITIDWVVVIVTSLIFSRTIKVRS
ncbi:MAG: hypothetical protein K9N36_01495 [Candidatus Marinimicrobia bacterium]|nr:hypothetical protein [Candidatus Neomarinimicrobiota bacterium]